MLSSWLRVLLELSTGEVDCSFRRNALKRYIAIYMFPYFHSVVMTNIWPYTMSRGAPYKKCCVKDWWWL